MMINHRENNAYRRGATGGHLSVMALGYILGNDPEMRPDDPEVPRDGYASLRCCDMGICDPHNSMTVTVARPFRGWQSYPCPSSSELCAVCSDP